MEPHLNGNGAVASQPSQQITTSILDEAKRLVAVDRAKEYGPSNAMCERIAKIWSVVLGLDVAPAKVALCLLGMKLAREAYQPKRDNRIDLAGYAEILDRLYGGTD